MSQNIRGKMWDHYKAHKGMASGKADVTYDGRTKTGFKI